MDQYTSFKTCGKCKVEYPATTEYFHRCSRLPGGLLYYCKRCRNKKEPLPKGEKRCSKCKGIFEATAYYFHRNRSTKDGLNSLCKPCGIIQGKASYTKWAAKYPEKRRLAGRRYWAKKHHAQGSHTLLDIETLFNSQKGLCWWCGKPAGNDYHVDHRIALSKGGSDNPSNLCISCVHCNESKGAKMPWEFNGRLL